MSEKLIEELQESYSLKREKIRERLNEFAKIRAAGSDKVLFEELVFCIFTAGASARMGISSLDRIRNSLRESPAEELASLLTGAHRYPNSRAKYIVHTREYLKDDCRLKLRRKLDSFGEDSEARRDFFARNKGIKGIGYKEASHYLRNIGYTGYAILDKHILKSLYEFGELESPDPPSNKKKYLEIEDLMRNFSDRIRIGFDELDLLLWSNKTGEILK